MKKEKVIRIIFSIVTIALYITSYFVTSIIYPEYSESVFSILVSLGFIVCFYITTSLYSYSKDYLIVFSVYFVFVAIFLFIAETSMRLPQILRLFLAIFFITFTKPIVQFYEFIDGCVVNISGHRMGDLAAIIYFILFIVLFYIVYFVSRCSKKRKVERN